MWYGALLGALIQIVGSLVARALLALGIGVVAYKGMDLSIAWAKDHFFSAAGALPPVALQALGVMQVDTSVEMLCSALLMRLAFNGMTAGVAKSFVLK